MALDGSDFSVGEIFGQGFIVQVGSGEHALHYVTFNGTLVHKAFKRLGDALAALGFAINGEWKRIELLRAVIDERVFVGVVAAIKGVAGTAFVLEIVESVAGAAPRVKYRVLFNGELSNNLSKDKAFAQASAYAGVGTMTGIGIR